MWNARTMPGGQKAWQTRTAELFAENK